MTKKTSKKRSKPWKSKFIKALAISCNVTLAAKAAGISRGHVYLERENDADFATAWKRAKEEALDILEAEAYRRAQKSSDTLMIFLLKAHKPSKYRDNVNVKHEGDVTVTVRYAEYNPKTS